MVYDAEERMTSLAEKLSVTTAYVYDGEGQRVEQSNALGTTVFVYDAFGNLAAEYATTAPAAAGTQYLIADQLGSTRLVMGGTLERHDYLPFGTETPVSAWQWQNGVLGYGADSFVRWRFAGQERDSLAGTYTGLYHFPARYMSPDQGRFLSVDPGNAGADGTNPAEWNGYSYVENMPLAYTDPSGQDGEAAEIGAEICGPWCAGAGALVDFGLLLSDLLDDSGAGSQPKRTPLPPSVEQPPTMYNPSMPEFFAQATTTPSANQCTLSPRDTRYLNLYYRPVSQSAPKYQVSPALVLGLGIESGFASQGTYLRTGDAFGMTGGSTSNMTTASSPTQNVNQFFTNYGNQVKGAGSNVQIFLSGLQGKNQLGQPVKGWKIFNSKHASTWLPMAQSGIRQMQREIPIYNSGCVK